MRRTSSKEPDSKGQLTFLLADPHASLFPSQDSEVDWQMRAATSRSDILPWLTRFAPGGSSMRMCPAFCRQLPTVLPINIRRQSTWTVTTDPATGKRSWLLTNTTAMKTMRSPVSWPDFQNSGMGGATGVLTLNTSVWRSGASVCSLSVILERGNLPLRYYLTAKACLGILRRAVKRGKELPALLARALRQVADSGRTSNSGGGYSLSPALTASGRGTERTGDSRGQDCVIPILEAGARTGKSTTDLRAGIGIGEAGDPMYTLQGGKQHAVAFQERGRKNGPNLELQDELAYALTAPNGGGRRQEMNIAVADVAPTLESGSNRTGGVRPPGTTVDTTDCLVASTGDISHCLNAGGMGRIDYETETLVTHALRAEGFDASEDGTGRGIPLIPEVTHALTRRCGTAEEDGTGRGAQLVPVAFRAAGQDGFTPSETSPPLCSTDGGGTVPTVAFSCKDSGLDAGDVSPTLRAMEFDGSHANGGGQVAVAFETRIARNGRGNLEDVVPPLKAESGQTGKGDSAPCVVQGGLQVRRLTTIETARLMGFSDTYCHIPRRPRKIEPDEAGHYIQHGVHCWQDGEQWWTKAAADGNIYRAHGNSMAVPCISWIGERIQTVDKCLAAAKEPDSMLL